MFVAAELVVAVLDFMESCADDDDVSAMLEMGAVSSIFFCTLGSKSCRFMTTSFDLSYSATETMGLWNAESAAVSSPEDHRSM